MSNTDAANPTDQDPTQQLAEFIDLPENLPVDHTSRPHTHESENSDDQ